MKQNKRMNTNQTNNSNKKSTQIPHDNPSFQLPKIQKTSNYDTNSNLSYDLDFSEQKQPRYPLDEIEENQKEQFGLVNYDKITMEQIKHEYQRLRDEVNTLTSEIKKKNQLFQSKIMKKQPNRSSNSNQTQKKLAQTQQQVYENSQLLYRLRQQYQQLEKRSNLANSSISRPNAEMNQKILTLREKIMTTKEKIKLLKRKTKKTGNDIVDGENIHQVFQKLDKELKSYQSKQANLQSRIDGSRYKLQRQDQMLSQIQTTYSNAQDYLKLFRLQTQQITQKNSFLQQYKQRAHKQQVIRKKIQSDQQTNLQKYHQLLKLFELQAEKEDKIDRKLIEGDVKILKAGNSILELERQLEELEDILGTMNEQINLKKEAELLRMAVERNNTFMTENGFAMTSNSINSHMVGVNSIIEENQSQVRDTIENVDHRQTIQTISMTGHSNNVRVKTKDNKSKHMFTKLQIGNESLPKKENRTNATAKTISEQPPSFTQAKYYLSTKEISKKREQQKNITTLRKQSSTNDNRNGRKVYSLIKPNDASKLKELSMNRTANKQIKELKIPNIRDDRREKESIPQTAKKPYISLSKNTNEKEEKGKQYLRQRKGSLKIVTKAQQNNTKEVKAYLLDELQQIKRQLQKKMNENQNIRSQKQTTEQLNVTNSQDLLEKLQKTKPIYEKQRQRQKPTSNGRISQDLSTRAQLTGKIIKPSSKEGRVTKPDSRQGKIRHQPAIKSQMMEEIDKRNIQYTKKIQEMKQQLIDKEGGGYEMSEKNVGETKATTIQPRQQATVIDQGQNFIQQQKMISRPKVIQKSHHIEPSLLGQISIITHQQKSPQQDAQSVLSEDGDIEQDLSEINRMIKQKLHGQGISAE